MKRFWVFAGDTHYPQGGMKDYVIAWDTEAEARAYAVGRCETALTWAHVYDVELKQIIYEGSKRL
jgi:hypothetical protein